MPMRCAGGLWMGMPRDKNEERAMFYPNTLRGFFFGLLFGLYVVCPAQAETLKASVHRIWFWCYIRCCIRRIGGALELSSQAQFYFFNRARF